MTTLNSYLHYDAQGNLLDIMAEDVSGMYFMSDLPGFSPR